MDMSWMGPCWTGINCGDAGGWISGIATLIAVLVALFISRAETRNREQERKAVDASAAAALHTEIIDIVVVAESALKQLLADSIYEQGLPEFLARNSYRSQKRLDALRQSFFNVPPQAAVHLAQMAGHMDSFHEKCLLWNRLAAATKASTPERLAIKVTALERYQLFCSYHKVLEAAVRALFELRILSWRLKYSEKDKDAFLQETVRWRELLLKVEQQIVSYENIQEVTSRYPFI